MSWGQATLTHLARLLRGGGEHSLVVLDVVGLSAVNLQQGRRAGDAVLSACGRMLVRRLSTAHVEHWLGDQFLVLLPDTRGTAAQQLVSPALGPHPVQTPSTSYWLCGGGATSLPAGTTNLMMVRMAAQALAEAKGHGRGTLVWADLASPTTTEPGHRRSPRPAGP